MKKIKILIVDDHEMVRLGLKTLIENQPDLQVAAEADSVENALKMAAKTRFDLALLDIRLKGGSGFDLCRQFKAQEAPPHVLILTSYDSDDLLLEAAEAGADGFLLKDADGHRLIESIRKIAAGERILDQSMATSVFSALQKQRLSGKTKETGELSRQELRVLAQVARGKTNKEIGSELGLTEKTIKNYLSNAMGKLGISRRSEAAVYYVTHLGGQKASLHISHPF
ncbi:MAG: response regulator transcription factor [Methylacidiphilales bacterium]|nr:response regulator transcription factor [Candidatus Methylacidiphilales bacterium]